MWHIPWEEFAERRTSQLHKSVTLHELSTPPPHTHTLTSSNQIIGITTSEILPVSLKEQEHATSNFNGFHINSKTSRKYPQDLHMEQWIDREHNTWQKWVAWHVAQGTIFLRNSWHTLHVEVELQTDGHIERDTRLLEKTHQQKVTWGNIKGF